MVWRTVKLDRCGCEKKVKGHATMMLYDGNGDAGANSSVSTCSQHSYLRGAKQRVKSIIIIKEAVKHFVLIVIYVLLSY